MYILNSILSISRGDIMFVIILKLANWPIGYISIVYELCIFTFIFHGNICIAIRLLPACPHSLCRTLQLPWRHKDACSGLWNNAPGLIKEIRNIEIELDEMEVERRDCTDHSRVAHRMMRKARASVPIQRWMSLYWERLILYYFVSVKNPEASKLL